MAGEWIKISSNLSTKPEVFQMARLLSETRRATVGLLVHFWCWADNMTVDGVVDGVETRDVDEMVDKLGFCDALISVGWLRKLPDRPGIEIINFDRHNGESAKKRVLKNERQARWRANKVDEDVDCAPSTRASTREEKRRDINPIVPSPKFAQFWNAYPSRRRLGKGKCLAIWTKQGFEAVGDQIALHVAAMCGTRDWTKDGGKFVPSAQTYLNQRRFEDGLPEDPKPRLVV